MQAGGATAYLQGQGELVSIGFRVQGELVSIGFRVEGSRVRVNG